MLIIESVLEKVIFLQDVKQFGVFGVGMLLLESFKLFRLRNFLFKSTPVTVGWFKLIVDYTPSFHINLLGSWIARIFMHKLI